MTETSSAAEAEYAGQLTRWRNYLAARPEITDDDAAELEDHLTSQVEDLRTAGLAADEAFLIAIKRLGSQSALAADFARENSTQLWKQFVVEGAPASSTRDRSGVWPMLAFAVGAALVVLLGMHLGRGTPVPDESSSNIRLPFVALGVAAVLAGYLKWRHRRLDRSGIAAVAGALVATGLAAALYPFTTYYADTFLLFAMHLPIALAVLLGIPYLGADWRNPRRWMDYIRFVGEWFIYYVLVALGGGVLIGLSMGIFGAFGIDAESVLTEWMLPAGIGGAMVVTAWLVQLKRSVVENMAPVLTMVFTPLFTALLLVFLGTVILTGRLLDMDRSLLIIIDLLLVVVWGLLLFAVSARPEGAKPRLFDWLQVVLVSATLAVDLLVLTAIAMRIGEWGATPNRLAALGENLVLAANLAWSLWLYVGFLRRRRAFAELEDFQSRYLPVVGVWAAFVMFAIPPLFGFA